MSRRRLALAARTILVLGMLAAASGCVGARGYFGDRWADAKDVFTATVGLGDGAKVRVGPVNAGLFYNQDIAGLRGGEGFCFPHPSLSEDLDCVIVLFYGVNGFNLRNRTDRLYPPDTLYDQKVGPTMRERNKCFTGLYLAPFLPLEFPRAPYYYTQIEVAAGTVGTLRLGFNPGELLDFLLGWTTLDIFSDDLAARRARGAAEKATELPPAGPPPAPARD